LQAIETLRAVVDTLIIVSNDRLLQIIPENTPLERAFTVADDVLRQGGFCVICASMQSYVAARVFKRSALQLSRGMFLRALCLSRDASMQAWWASARSSSGRD
jgi:hypothetical protein